MENFARGGEGGDENEGNGTYVRPVERRTPARKADTTYLLVSLQFFKVKG